MPEDLGKDINSVQALIRKHETFENDLLAMEGHLQGLVNDAARLQEEYPGGDGPISECVPNENAWRNA